MNSVPCVYFQVGKSTPLSKYLDFSQKSHIAAICDIQEVKAGTRVIQENEDGDTMFITAKGELFFEANHKKLSQSNLGDFLIYTIFCVLSSTETWGIPHSWHQ